MIPSKDKNDAKNGKLLKNNEPTQKTLTSHSSLDTESKKNSHKTQIIVKYDVGFSNHLFIRGKGASLNWDKGTPLKNRKADEWIWETDGHFTQCEFKVLINDQNYETGENHVLTAGSSVVYTPRF